MSYLDKEANFSLKVMVNKEKNKVLFAEVDNDFAEVLLSFLTLPLGETVKKLQKHHGNKRPLFGSLPTLYKGLADLDDDYFSTKAGKQMLLNPRNSFFTERTKLFRCINEDCAKLRPPTVTMYYGTRNCDCGNPLSRPMSEFQAVADNEGILAKKRFYFLVTDDLQMAPIEPGFLIQTLVNLGIVVTQGAELMNVILGYNQIMDLLKGSLLSKTPLTDTILHQSTKMNCVGGDSLYEVEENALHTSKKMIVKARLRKSTNKLLFVEAEEDFVDFLFSFLTIPLGGVECLLGSKTCLKNIHNLCRSIDNLIDDKYMRARDTKKRLMNPELPPKYLSKNQIFALSEQITPPIYFFKSVMDSTNRTVENGSWMCVKDPKGDEGSFVVQRKFMVMDNLTVVPWSVSRNAAVIQKGQIPLEDVKDVELLIGLKEGLNILKASLVSSTSALTHGLINPFLKKRPEHG